MQDKLVDPSQFASEVETLRWILSTTSQGAAALVAIIGGFLLSRVLSISAERRLIESEIGFLRKDVFQKEESLNEMQRLVYGFERTAFAKQHLSRIVELEGDEEAFFEDAERNNKPVLPDHALASDYCRKVRETLQALATAFPGNEPISAEQVDNSTWVATHLPNHMEVLPAVIKQQNEVRKSAREAEQQRKATEAAKSDSILSSILKFQASIPRNVLGITGSAAHIRPMNFDVPDPYEIQIRKQLTNLESELIGKTDRLDHLRGQLRQLKDTKGHKGAFVVIGLFGLLGIIGPQVVSLFPWNQPLQVGWWVLAVLTALFAALMIYMWIQLKGLADTPPSEITTLD